MEPGSTATDGLYLAEHHCHFAARSNHRIATSTDAAYVLLDQTDANEIGHGRVSPTSVTNSRSFAFGVQQERILDQLVGRCRVQRNFVRPWEISQLMSRAHRARGERRSNPVDAFDFDYFKLARSQVIGKFVTCCEVSRNTFNPSAH